MQFDGIKNSSSGVPLFHTMSLASLAKTSSSLDLHESVISLELSADGSVQFLTVRLSGRTSDLSDRFITLDENSRIIAKVAFSDLVIDYLSGRLLEQEVVLDTITTVLHLPDQLDDLDHVHFGDARMTMDLYSTVQLPIRFEAGWRPATTKGTRSPLR